MGLEAWKVQFANTHTHTSTIIYQKINLLRIPRIDMKLII